MGDALTFGASELHCADCRSVPDCFRVDAIIFDPPYGVGATYGHSYDDDRKKYWEWFLPCLDGLRKHAPLMAFTHRVKALEKIVGWDWVGVWNKPYGGGARIGNSPLLPHWEPIFIFGAHTLGTKNADYLPDVITMNPDSRGAPRNAGIGRDRLTSDEVIGHPFPKPVKLFEKLIMGLTSQGQTVWDPFMGSGTTAIAALNTGRRFVGHEIEPTYFEIAKARVQGFLNQGRLVP